MAWDSSSTVFVRNTAGYPGVASMLGEIWVYSGIDHRPRTDRCRCYPSVRAQKSRCAARRTVPRRFHGNAGLHYQTTWSIDMHLAYGIWFACHLGGLCMQQVHPMASQEQKAARSAMLRNGVGSPGCGKLASSVWAAIRRTAKCRRIYQFLGADRSGESGIPSICLHERPALPSITRHKAGTNGRHGTLRDRLIPAIAALNSGEASYYSTEPE